MTPPTLTDPSDPRLTSSTRHPVPLIEPSDCSPHTCTHILSTLSPNVSRTLSSTLSVLHASAACSCQSLLRSSRPPTLVLQVLLPAATRTLAQMSQCYPTTAEQGIPARNLHPLTSRCQHASATWGFVHLTPHIPPPERWEPYLARCAAPPQRGRTSLASVLTQGTGRAGHSPASARRCCRGRRARKTQSVRVRRR